MRYRRIIVPGGCYFFTVNLQDRKSRLLTDNINTLRLAFQKTMQHHPFIIEAIVIMPDHLHMIMRLPENDGNFSLRWNCIKSCFSRHIPDNEYVLQARKNRGERGIWQRRFWEHLIRDERDFEHHVNYIHHNPVKHGYVSHPSQWPWSSIHRFIQKGILTQNWAIEERNGAEFGERA